MTRRIGILGGTFDPIHVGHLEAAAVARRALRLDTVRFMPSRTPLHRHDPPRASPFHRFAMVALAVAGCEGFQADDDELCAEGPSFTSATLARLHRKGCAPGELFFVLGGDAFVDIASWHEYPAVLDAAHFAVVARSGTSTAAVRARVPALVSRMIDASDAAALDAASAGPTRIVLISADTPDVSSTEVRRCIARGEPLDGLVPPAVANHIGRHGLYRVN